MNSMLRLNQFLITNHLRKASNVLTKSNYYYSSEPPEEVLTVPIGTSANRLKAPKVDALDTFLRTTRSERDLFGPHDMRAPLNGNIGIALNDAKQLECKQLLELIRKVPKTTDLPTIEGRDFDIQLLSNTSESRCHKFFRILRYQRLFPREMSIHEESANGMDCRAHDLSLQVIKKFELLFPTSQRRELSEGLTAMTLTKRTVNDMSAFSEPMELEREEFFEKFVTEAKDICKELQKNGFWADFIDPYSGQPFLSDHNSSDTLFETDDRFLHLGFKIEDLGCCKAMYHKKWGTHVIVGTLFTTAPANTPALIKLMANSVGKQSEVSL